MKFVETILFPADNPTLEVPARPNAVVDYPLTAPIRLFGRTYRTLYVSHSYFSIFHHNRKSKVDI